MGSKKSSSKTKATQAPPRLWEMEDGNYMKEDGTVLKQDDGFPLNVEMITNIYNVIPYDGFPVDPEAVREAARYDEIRQAVGSALENDPCSTLSKKARKAWKNAPP